MSCPNVLEKQLGYLSSTELGTLENGMMGLPPGTKMEVAIATEKIGRNDLADAVLPAATPEDVIQRLVTGAPILHGDTAKAKKIVDACGGSVEGLNTCIGNKRLSMPNGTPVSGSLPLSLRLTTTPPLQRHRETIP